MLWLLASGAGCVCFGAVALGTFVPLRDAAGIEYLFAWSGAARLAALAGAIALSLWAARLAVVAACRRLNPPRVAAARAAAWLSPLAALAIVVLGILPAVPGVGVYGAPAAYLFYDLRWWWLVGALASTVARVDALLDKPVRHAVARLAYNETPGGQVVLETLLAVIVAAWAVMTTPNLRFIGVLHGDEPKYVRYCEVWYQGGGADISQKRFFSEEPLDAPPRVVQALGGAVKASAQEAAALVRDLRDFVRSPASFRWNRATGDNGFVHGKHGGMYEIYQPGVSAVLMPGYLVDRYLIGIDPGYNDEFPAELPMTSSMMLLTYGACAVALFRLLRHALGEQALASLWAAIGTMTLPTAAFAFQLYPELPAAVVIVSVTTGVMFARAPSRSAALLAGAAAASLAWLHPRFLAVSACLLVLGVIGGYATRRRVFVLGFSAILLTLLAYDYRITGSWLPTALWAVSSPEGPLHGSAVPLNLVAYGLDWRWGLFPQAPMLLALLPGLALMARRSLGQALALAALGLALAVPASAHTIHAAGGTPGRLVLAVVPLAAWPVAVFVRYVWQSKWLRVAAVASIVLSLDTALAYNWSHHKPIGPMADVSVSGWKVNLAFPAIRDELWNTSPHNFALFLAILALLVVASAVVASGRGVRPATTEVRVALWTAPVLSVLLLALVTAATSANGIWYSDRYLIDNATATDRAAAGLVALNRCTVCFTSRRAATDWTQLEPNGADGVRLDVGVSQRRLSTRVTIEAPPSTRAFGRVRVDYGDHTSTSWAGAVSATDFQHTYARGGTYDVTAWLQLRDGTLRSDRAMVTIAPSSGD